MEADEALLVSNEEEEEEAEEGVEAEEMEAVQEAQEVEEVVETVEVQEASTASPTSKPSYGKDAVSARAEKAMSRAEKAAAARAKADERIQAMAKWPILGSAVQRQVEAMEAQSGKKRRRVSRSAKKVTPDQAELPTLVDVIAKQLIANAKNAR